VELTFWPAARGAFDATLTIASDAIDSPGTVAISGQGIAPVATVSPQSLDFGSLRAGESAAQRTVTLTNTGDAPLAISSVAVSGAGFSGSSDCPATLEPSGACTLRAGFTSSAAGAANGAITVSHDASGGSSRIGLSASALDFRVYFPYADASAPRGGTGAYTVVLERTGGLAFTFPVTLSCAGGPAGCSFSPSQTVTPGYQTAVTLQVPVPATGAVPGGAASLGLVLVPLSALAARSRRRRGALLALLLLAVAGATACADDGGGGVGDVGGQADPAQYTITVTATSGALVHTATATLYVR
jgi:hypothetical protein